MFDINKLKDIRSATPFYFYDIALLRRTIDVVRDEAQKLEYQVHYALKANANPELLEHIVAAGFGADCVSGNEILRAVECGFDPALISFAGVGKSDEEIAIGLDNNIGCFNCESTEEMEVLDRAAAARGRVVDISIRINPNVDAGTHANITTGLSENKFGVTFEMFDRVAEAAGRLKNLNLNTIHFHVGSQITNIEVFSQLCRRANEANEWFSQRFDIRHVDLGGGLGIDYAAPDENPIPDFAGWFSAIERNIKLRPGQILHMEPGRSIVGQCGTLITKVLYVKKGISKEFVIVDAGMSDLIRPMLYQAAHKIENISSSLPERIYDVVGPICESTDTFAKEYSLPETQRGDLIAIRSSGAYGEVMASRYNLRALPPAVYSSGDKL